MDKCSCNDFVEYIKRRSNALLKYVFVLFLYMIYILSRSDHPFYSLSSVMDTFKESLLELQEAVKTSGGVAATTRAGQVTSEALQGVDIFDFELFVAYFEDWHERTVHLGNSCYLDIKQYKLVILRQNNC